MSTTKREMANRLTILFLLVMGVFSVSPAFSVETRTTHIAATVNEIFTARFAFYRDTNPDPTDPDLGTEIPGTTPNLNFNIVWDGGLDWVTVPGDSNRRILMARNLGADSVVRVLIGVINNTGRAYHITHRATPLASGGTRLPAGSYIVTSFVDPGPQGFPNPQVGSPIATAPQSQPAVGEKTLYSSDGPGTGTVVHLIYSISNGYDESGHLRAGVDPNSLIGVNYRAGSYAGDLTITVTQ